MCTFQQHVGVHYAEDLHRSVLDASVNYSQMHVDRTSIGRLCLMQTS